MSNNVHSKIMRYLSVILLIPTISNNMEHKLQPRPQDPLSLSVIAGATCFNLYPKLSQKDQKKFRQLIDGSEDTKELWNGFNQLKQGNSVNLISAHDIYFWRYIQAFYNDNRNVLPMQNQDSHAPGFSQLDRIKEYVNKSGNLNIEHGEVNRLPKDILHIENLKIFTAQYNQLTEIPPIPADSCLTEITLNNNYISQLPTSLRNCIHLTHLNLSHNNLHNLPKFILANLALLQYLNISNNNLSKLSLPNLLRLEQLWIGMNKLDTMPTNLPSSLQKLDVSSNRIKDVKTLSFLPELTYVNISGNKTKKFPSPTGWNRMQAFVATNNKVPREQAKKFVNEVRVHNPDTIISVGTYNDHPIPRTVEYDQLSCSSSSLWNPLNKNILDSESESESEEEEESSSSDDENNPLENSRVWG